MMRGTLSLVVALASVSAAKTIQVSPLRPWDPDLVHSVVAVSHTIARHSTS